MSWRAVFDLARDRPPAGGVDRRGLSSLRSRIEIEADAEPGPGWRARVTGHASYDLAYRVNGRGGYPRGFLDAYESEAELGEAYVRGQLSDDLDVALGRRIVVWGRSDSLRVTDLLNPLDNRRPGMTDIGDLRLPVAMAQLDYYARPWSLSLIAIPERRFDERPVPGSEFFAGTVPLPPRDAPEHAFGTPEIAVALNGTFPGWDISAYAANVFDDRPHVEATAAGARRRHGRVWMAGAAGNAVFGSWLFKAEAALLDGLRYSNAPGREFVRLDVLAGLEYSGFTDTTLSFEAVNRHLLDFDPRLAARPDERGRNEPASALRITRRFRNDTVEVTLVALTFGLGGEAGAIQRLQIAHDWSDAITLSGGVVLYASGDRAPLRGIGANDRVFATLEYQF